MRLRLIIIVFIQKIATANHAGGSDQPWPRFCWLWTFLKCGYQTERVDGCPISSKWGRAKKRRIELRKFYLMCDGVSMNLYVVQKNIQRLAKSSVGRHCKNFRDCSAVTICWHLFDFYRTSTRNWLSALMEQLHFFHWWIAVLNGMFQSLFHGHNAKWRLSCQNQELSHSLEEDVWRDCNLGQQGVEQSLCLYLVEEKRTTSFGDKSSFPNFTEHAWEAGRCWRPCFCSKSEMRMALGYGRLVFRALGSKM